MPERRDASDRRQADRRLETRRLTSAPVRFLRATDGGRSVLEGELIDVAEQGVALLLREELDRGETLLVEVRTEEHCLNLSATVVWSQPEDAWHRTGCELRVGLTPQQVRWVTDVAVAAPSP